MNEINAKNIKNNGGDCSPINSIYCTLKMKILGKLNEKNLNNLYRCTLCNECKTASFNHNTRKLAVCSSLILPHVNEIRENIDKFGNPYGIKPSFKEKEEIDTKTILFRGCTPAYKTPEILESAENLLEQNDINYGFINDEKCCGNILFNLGDYKSGIKIVKENVEKFKKLGINKIITVCPGCYSAFNKYYKGYDGFNPEIILAIDLFNESISMNHDFIIQDPCHAKDRSDKVREIVRGSKNKNAGSCCGAGAGVLAHDKQLATLKAKKSLDKHHGDIITYCPFCYINLSSVKLEKAKDIYVLLDEQSK